MHTPDMRNDGTVFGQLLPKLVVSVRQPDVDPMHRPGGSQQAALV